MLLLLAVMEEDKTRLSFILSVVPIEKFGEAAEQPAKGRLPDAAELDRARYSFGRWVLCGIVVKVERERGRQPSYMSSRDAIVEVGHEHHGLDLWTYMEEGSTASPCTPIPAPWLCKLTQSRRPHTPSPINRCETRCRTSAIPTAASLQCVIRLFDLRQKVSGVERLSR